mmetsp:Transcript_68484/g.130337  ORF Transcript_68484/g.130337 Transcript_68484/m.130337 type:complete len:309 (-) Transcript_68484:67-993(-)
MWSTRARLFLPAASGALTGLAGINGIDRFGFKRNASCEEIESSFSQSEFRRFPILDVKECGPMTNVIKCKLPSDQHRMGMTVTSYVLVGGAEGGDTGSGAYTPISTDEQAGYFELLIKGYPNGVVSKYLCSLKAGDSIEVKGPFKKLPYKANMKKKIGMIAGGSGITPMLQIAKEVLKNPDDKTELTLLFGNQTPKDILIREELDQLAADSKGQLKVFYVVDRNDTQDKKIKHVGYMDKACLSSTLPSPSPDTLIFICGPPPMIDALAGKKKFRRDDPCKKGHPFFGQGGVSGVLAELKYEEQMVYKF